MESITEGASAQEVIVVLGDTHLLNFQLSAIEENVKEVDKLNLDIKAGEDFYKLELS